MSVDNSLEFASRPRRSRTVTSMSIALNIAMLRHSNTPFTLSISEVILALSLAASLYAQAAQESVFSGKAVEVMDGDTIGVLSEGNVLRKVRLSGIDAPEKKQPFGQRSKEGLSRLVFGRTVEVRWSKKDRYGRVVGKVLADGRDVCLEQIRRGWAWHYRKYEKEQPERDRLEYSRSEGDARAARLGLWADSNPVPPWDWRRMGR